MFNTITSMIGSWRPDRFWLVEEYLVSTVERLGSREEVQSICDVMLSEPCAVLHLDMTNPSL